MVTSHHRNGQQEWIKNIILMRTSMKRAVLYSVVLFSFTTLLIQCVATQQDVEYTNVKVRKMDTKVDDINKEIEDLKKQTVQGVQARQAETGDRLDYQQSEILRLQGQIEENNFLMQQIQEENKELKKLLLTRLDSSEQDRSEEINRLNERLALADEQLQKAMERVAYAEDEIMAIKEARSHEASQRAMEAAQPSRTALHVAMRRAAHQMYDAQPLVFSDPIAVPIELARGSGGRSWPQRDRIPATARALHRARRFPPREESRPPMSAAPSAPGDECTLRRGQPPPRVCRAGAGQGKHLFYNCRRFDLCAPSLQARWICRQFFR